MPMARGERHQPLEKEGCGYEAADEKVYGVCEHFVVVVIAASERAVGGIVEQGEDIAG